MASNRPSLQMREEGKFQRVRERLDLKLPVRIRCRETPDFEWTEMTRLINVSPFGAGFKLKRPVERGRILHMTLPLPRQLRVFDHVEDQYRVWALVRRIQPVETPNEPTQFEVGVAFIGKHPPRSYLADPAKRYEPSTKPSGFIEAEDWKPPELVGADKRKRTRHNIPVDLKIDLLDDRGNLSKSEQTVTENISASGAAIYTTLDVPVGRVVRVTSEQYRISVYAAVRAHSVGPTGLPRIHVEFVDREWPL